MRAPISIFLPTGLSVDGQAFVEPDGDLNTGVLHQQMRELVHRHGIILGRDVLHDDVVAIIAAQIKSRGEFIGPERFVFLFRAERDDARSGTR